MFVTFLVLLILILKNRCSVLFKHWTVVRVRHISVCHVMAKRDWEGTDEN